jgi:hypothetical protein
MLAAARSTPEGLRAAALSVSGVRDATVRESPHGLPGEVEIVVDGPDLEEEGSRERILAALRPRRPAGIKVDVVGVRRVRLAIDVTVTLREGAVEKGAVRSVEETIRREAGRMPPGTPLQRNRLVAAILQLAEVREVEDVWVRSRALDDDTGTLVDDTRSRERAGDLAIGPHERAEVESVEVHTQWSPREYVPVLVMTKVVATLESRSLRADAVRDRLAANIDSYVGQMRRGEPLEYSRLRAIARNTPGVVDVLDLELDAFYHETSVRVEGIREDLRLGPAERARPGAVRLEVMR